MRFYVWSPVKLIAFTFFTDNLDRFKVFNYGEIKMSWEMKSIHDYFSFQIVMVDDSIWTISMSSNYDEIKMSWEMKSIHDYFSFQIVMVDDSS
jgi:hypothetical protein